MLTDPTILLFRRPLGINGTHLTQICQMWFTNLLNARTRAHAQ